MSRSLSAAAVVIFLLIGFLATLTSGAPTTLARGEPDIARRHRHYNSTSSTNPTNSTTSTDSTDTTNTTDTTDSTDSTNTTVTDDSVSNANALSTSTTGEATWYTPGLGACGQTNTESDFIVALNAGDWAGGSHCGQQLQITNTQNGKSCTATVRDLCPGCGSGGLDMSPAVFDDLDGSLDPGVFPISWYFI